MMTAKRLQKELFWTAFSLNPSIELLKTLSSFAYKEGPQVDFDFVGKPMITDENQPDIFIYKYWLTLAPSNYL